MRAPRPTGMSIRAPVAKAQMQSTQNLDLVLLVDCTASMKPLIKAVENQLQRLLMSMEEQYERLKIRVAFVGYRDFDAPERYTIYDFCSINQILPYLRDIRTDCGLNPDTAEDVLGGYYQVTKLSWASKFKILLHFGDAPAHGSRFHNWNFENCDHYKDHLPPEHPSECADIYIDELIQRRVNTIFFQVGNPAWTNKMKDVFQQIYTSRGHGRKFSAVQLSLTEDSNSMSTEFLDKVINTTSMSLMSMGASDVFDKASAIMTVSEVIAQTMPELLQGKILNKTTRIFNPHVSLRPHHLYMNAPEDPLPVYVGNSGDDTEDADVPSQHRQALSFSESPEHRQKRSLSDKGFEGYFLSVNGNENVKSGRASRLQAVSTGSQTEVQSKYTSIVRAVSTRRRPINASKLIGASPISDALKAQFESHPISEWLATFVNSELEREFMSVQEDFLEFRVFIYGTSSVMIFAATTIVKQPFKEAVLITIYTVIAPWLTVTFSVESNNPLEFIGIPALYAMIGVTCLMTARDREFKIRKIYLMELLLSQQIGIPLEDVQSMPVSEIIAKTRFKGSDRASHFKPDAEMVAVTVKASSRIFRLKKWIRNNVLVHWDNESLKTSYLLWRQKTFLSHLRLTFYLLAFFDLYSAFINPLTYCNDQGKNAISPSLCGAKGWILRNIRLSLLPLLLVGAFLSHLKVIEESPKISQYLFVIVFSLRGVALEAMYGLVIKWNRTDETSFLILSTLIAKLFVACGSSVLLMDMYFIFCLILVVSSIVIIISIRLMLPFLFLLLCVAVPLGASYNIQMEKTEHQFFALWEILCETDET
ncbi:hypothetical protein HDU67_007500 [Dinochytrium kinnereticum]|nr:hypothetical protein HDU67_007500 [Dinochytrium kinnereticum]